VDLTAAQQDWHMTEIIFVTHDRTEYRVAAEVGRAVMQAALFNGPSFPIAGRPR
jgi:hypothetical protein